MVEVEPYGLIVLGIDHERIDGHFGSYGPRGCVPQEAGSELASPIGLVDGEAAEPCHRYGWIPRKAFSEGFRQIGEGDARRGERVVPGDLRRGCVERDVTGGHPPPHVLGHVLTEISIEGFHAARKLRPAVGGTEGLDQKRSGHCAGRISRAWASFARSSAGDGAGGLARIARDAFIEALYAAGIGCSVHYIPLHLHPYWRERYDLGRREVSDLLPDLRSADALVRRAAVVRAQTQLRQSLHRLAVGTELVDDGSPCRDRA